MSKPKEKGESGTLFGLEIRLATLRAEIDDLIMDIRVAQQRKCTGCGKVLSRKDIEGSQGWHCKKCWMKEMEVFKHE